MKYTDDYLTFYEAYGRHEGKAEGQKAWDKLDMLDREAAQRDVEERNRLNAWSKNKRLITMPSTYLNQRRWEDDWKSTVESARANPDGEIGSGPRTYSNNMSEQPELTFWEQVFGRAWFLYVVVPARGGLEPDRALAIRDEMMKTDTPAFDDEIESGSMTKKQAAREVLAAFVNRLDKEFGENRAGLVLRQVDRGAAERFRMTGEEVV